MERTVPYTASGEIELYLRTYYSLLRTSAEVQIRTLEEAHAGMDSLLHPLARREAPDLSAFIYSYLRLPEEIARSKTLILGQSQASFLNAEIGDVETWREVTAKARRRKYFYNGNELLASYIVSRSDIDDLIPLVTAFQIEWNKLHRLLSNYLRGRGFKDVYEELGEHMIAEGLHMEPGDLQSLEALWGDQFSMKMDSIASVPQKIQVRLLSGSLRQYRQATHMWWSYVEKMNPELQDRPVYFISSNPHSLVNILTGPGQTYRPELLSFIESAGEEGLLREWQDIQANEVPSDEENFFYYVLKKYAALPENAPFQEILTKAEQKCGIRRTMGQHAFDLEAQVIRLAELKKDKLDPRLKDSDLSILLQSDAVILNIDYPLGMAAYHVLTKISERVPDIRGIYIMGKAATLNGVVGDVMIPTVVHDEQSKNTYLFSNCFSARDITPYLVYGAVLDQQKSVTVRGTFLQTAHYMEVFYREGYTDIEMEAGPYLSALYEMVRPKRHPYNEIVNLTDLPLDLGIVHYASDKPLSKGKNLGAGSLSYYGMDPTYAASIAILKRILSLEKQRLS